MILRYRQGFSEKIIDVDYAEIEDFLQCEVKQGVWRFKDGSYNKGTN
jgi:hypothetical protein